MESQPQNLELFYNPENFHPCAYTLYRLKGTATLMITMFYMKDLNKP